VSKSFDGLDFRMHCSTCDDVVSEVGRTHVRRQGVSTGNAREETRKGTPVAMLATPDAIRPCG
jgi:hypothetical protein